MASRGMGHSYYISDDVLTHKLGHFCLITSVVIIFLIIGAMR